MKKAKLTFAVVAGLIATIGLSACDNVTYNEGVVLTFKDATGQRVDYTAAELFGDYESGSSAASTNFDKVYELLIRNYYNSDSQKTALSAINKDAQKKVNDLKSKAEDNAKTNGTSYEVEFETILDSNNCDNADELFDAMQYSVEKTKFETDFYADYIEAIRDGVYEEDTADGKHAKGDEFFPASATYGAGDEGYLKEKMPYHVRHILVKVSASSNELTQGEITEAEANNIGKVISELSGETEVSGKRSSFGEIAEQLSEDSSADSSGDLGIMDKDTSYVNEFKLGVYAYDAIYNKTSNAYRTAHKDSLLPTGDLDATGTKTIEEYFEEGETYDDNTTGIGQIPYGAAKALLSSAKVTGSDFGFQINNGDATYYPRNILFNKYFNKHNICVITPNKIGYNDAWTGTSGLSYDKASEKFDGTYDSTYGALPGFSVDTKDVLPQFSNNVLTNSEGQIVLAVRAGTSGDSSYQGVHFIVVQRSALNEYGNKFTTDTTTGAITKVEEETSDVSATSNTPTLSEYYTMKAPSEVGYPTYTEGAESKKMTTYVNFLHAENNTYKTRAEKVRTTVKGYNDSMNTYIFQQLISDGSITFANQSVGDKIANYISTKREKNNYDDEETWNDTWRTYAEYLINQTAQRELNDDGTQKLISETCAIGYTKDNLDAKNKTGEWAIGGACYDGK